MTARRWAVLFAAPACLLLALIAPMVTRAPADAVPTAYAPIKIVSVAHLSTNGGVALAVERVCNSADHPVSVFVSLSWQNHLTTTVYANIAAVRLPGCQKVYLRALQGDGTLVVYETPVQPNGLPGVTVSGGS